jgi:chorismate mutase
MRAIRGAIQVAENSVPALQFSVPRLLNSLLDENAVDYSEIVSILFTATPDLTADFPAAAARALPLGDVPLICASEIAVPGALERVVRVLLHVETDKSRAEIRHVYLDGAEALRKDLAQ